YLLLFLAPQVMIYLYLRERLPDPTRPQRARVLRRALAVVFIVLNLPWLVVGVRVVFGGSMWSIGRIPFTGPWIAWQLLGWIYCALVAVYVLGKAVWWLAQRVRGAWYVVTAGANRASVPTREPPRTTDPAPGPPRRPLPTPHPAPRPPSPPPPLPRPRHVRLRRRRRRPVGTRHLERLSAPNAH